MMVQFSDAKLVGKSRSGDRQAFAEIVKRYQNLVCSVAYGATGNLNASEELAQEAFVAAWGSLHSLQDADKLRSWLCGIVRNLARNRRRKRSRDLLLQADTIDSVPRVDETAHDPVDSTIAREEIDLLNQTICSLPENYREPLVLYYREQHSVARVAELLDLSPSAVKQRLARGRELLRQEVAAIVERGLLRSAPGAAFTLGVLAALPVMSGTAKAATVTVTTAKGVSAMQAAGWIGILGAILGPLAGLAGGWFGYSMSMKTARSEQERAFIRKSTLVILALVVLFGATVAAFLLPVTMTNAGRNWVVGHPFQFAIAIMVAVMTYVVALMGTITWVNRSIARIRQETGTVETNPAEVAAQLPAPFRPFQYTRIYDSPQTLLGVPLLSVRLHGVAASKTKTNAAVGWIAIGDGLACGIVFASGSVAVGGIAFGGLGIGLLGIGGLAAGAVALGGAAIGGWVSGGLGIGWCSFSGIAAAWHLAVGGIAVAKHYAMGGVAMATHANDEVAKALLESSQFFRWSGLLMSPFGWMTLVAFGLSPLLLAHRFIPATQVDGEERTSTPSPD